MEIDLSKQEPIPYKNTIAILNEYILQNIDLLNKFGHFNENKLYEMEVILDEIESKVLLLEKKLDSIPPDIYNGLVMPQPGQPIQAPPPRNAVDAAPPQETNTADPPPAQQYQQQPEQEFQNQDAQQQEAEPEQEEEQAQDPVMDERIQKYVKLLSYGVVPSQLKMKMQMEGLDPSLLDQFISKN